MLSNEEMRDSTLRAYLSIADQQKRASQISTFGNKLDNYRKSKKRLDEFYEFIAELQVEGLLNESRKVMCKKAVNLLIEITKIEGNKFLKNFLLN